jgi:hypothetical protein
LVSPTSATLNYAEYQRRLADIKLLANFVMAAIGRMEIALPREEPFIKGQQEIVTAFGRVPHPCGFVLCKGGWPKY